MDLLGHRLLSCRFLLCDSNVMIDYWNLVFRLSHHANCPLVYVLVLCQI